MKASLAARRPLFAALAALVVMVSLLALPPVRAAADQLLSIFRVEKVLFVPTSPERIEQLRNLNINPDTLFLSKPTAAKQSEPRTVASADEAAAAAGFAPRQPAVFPSAPSSTQFLVHNAGAVQFQVNIEAVRQLLGMLDITDVTLPDALGSAPITVEMPTVAAIRYQGADYTMTLVQGPSPKVTLPDGVELAQLGKAALRVLGMSSAQADIVSSQIDWSSTLLFPFPADVNNFRQVAIGDAQGLLVTGGESGRRHYQLYWQQGDRFYMLEGQANMRDSETTAMLIAMAESIR